MPDASRRSSSLPSTRLLVGDAVMVLVEKERSVSTYFCWLALLVV